MTFITVILLKYLLKSAKKTLRASFYNIKELTEKLLPSLSDDGKILMVSSMMGDLRFQGLEIQAILDNPQIDEASLFKVAKDYLEAAKNNDQENQGFSVSAYSISKVLLNTYSRFILRKIMKKTQQLYVLTPGWCKTELGTDNAPDSPDMGAETPVFLVELPYKVDPKYDSLFFENKRVKHF